MGRRGFSIIEGVLVVAVVALVIGIGTWALSGKQKTAQLKPTPTLMTAQEKAAQNVATVKTSGDLSQTAQEIDADSPDVLDADLNDVDADLKSF